MNSKEMTQKVADDIVSEITKAYNYELAHGFDEDEEDPEWDPYHDENTLTFYIEDRLETKFVIDEDMEYVSSILTLGYGGPNVYYHSDAGRVEVFWEGRAVAYVDPVIRDMIDDMIADYYSSIAH